MNDETQARLAAHGDRNAFGDLLSRHYDLIYRIGVHLSSSPQYAEDFTQDVCVLLARRIKSYSGEAKFTSWLYKVCLNHFRDEWRREKTKTRIYGEVEKVSATHIDPHDTEAVQKRWLYEVLAEMSLDLKETAILTITAGYSQSEAAKILNLPEGTIAWRMSEIKKFLRARKEKEEQSS